MGKRRGGYTGGSSIIHVDDPSEYGRRTNHRMWTNLKAKRKSLLELECEEFYRKKAEEEKKNG